jgi:hypothetical protein
MVDLYYNDVVGLRATLQNIQIFENNVDLEYKTQDIGDYYDDINN